MVVFQSPRVKSGNSTGIPPWAMDMIAFRKKHSAIRGECSPSGLGFPTVSVHTNQPWDNNVTQESKFLGVMFAGAVPAGSSQKTTTTPKGM